jgi:NADH-quinone oxidoreductase subunit J
MFIAVISAALLILLKNPIHSIFSLLISIISSICVLLLIKVEFLSYVFLIVYVGAIAILFLFVIMMLNIKVSNDTLIDYSSWEFYLMFPVILKFIVSMKIVVESYNPDLDVIGQQLEVGIVYENDIDIFSNLLYTYYFFVFILSSIVLLVSMIGALIITTNKNLIK